MNRSDNSPESQYEFKSAIAPYILGLIAEKRATGFVYKTEELVLIRFDKYCSDKWKNGVTPITQEFLSDWCTKSDTENISALNRRITVIRQLMLYMMSLGISVYLPHTVLRPERVLPHLFTEAERQEFFSVVDSYHPKSNSRKDIRLAGEYKVLFRMLYCCGLRNSEASGAPAECVDTSNGILTIRGGKKNKDRLVYLPDDLAELCARYFHSLCKEFGYQPEWFFPGFDPSKHVLNTSVDNAFKRYWLMTSFAAACNNQPTPHDLRFSFITDRINAWTKEGLNVNQMLPYLAKYVGHKSIVEVYYYYHTSEKLYDSIRTRDKTGPSVIPEVRSYDY